MRIAPRFARHVAILAFLAALAVAGCSRGPRNFANDNDRLRAANLELERTVADLQAALARRDAQLEALHQRRDGAPPLAGVVPPSLAKLELDRYSGPIDTDGDGKHDVLRLYLRPLDQDGRVIPIGGTATISLARVSEGSEPELIVRKAIDAETLGAAYRTGFTGTHYTFEIDLTGAGPGTATIAVDLVFTDAATGAEHRVGTGYHLQR